MDINEIRERREQLEKAVLKLIQDFEEQADIQVKEVRLDDQQRYLGVGQFRRRTGRVRISAGLEDR
jgi:TolB-like protein